MVAFLIRIFRHLFSFYWKARLGRLGRRSLLIKPLKIQGADKIYIEDNVVVHNGAWLSALTLSGGRQGTVRIGKGTVIGHFAHIVSGDNVTIKEKVLVADKVYISDNLHEYRDVSRPIIDQEVLLIDQVVIGEGAWIGENVSIMGASIGQGSVIGANSVVTKNIPPYSVAVGCPARVIKTYNKELKKWIKVSYED